MFSWMVQVSLSNMGWYLVDRTSDITEKIGALNPGAVLGWGGMGWEGV